jgi:hypothetical protein
VPPGLRKRRRSRLLLPCNFARALISRRTLKAALKAGTVCRYATSEPQRATGLPAAHRLRETGRSGGYLADEPIQHIRFFSWPEIAVFPHL